MLQCDNLHLPCKRKYQETRLRICGISGSQVILNAKVFFLSKQNFAQFQHRFSYIHFISVIANDSANNSPTLTFYYINHADLLLRISIVNERFRVLGAYESTSNSHQHLITFRRDFVRTVADRALRNQPLSNYNLDNRTGFDSLCSQ